MRLLRLNEVKAVFGYRSNSTVYSLIHQGLFPRSVAIHKRSVGWPDNEIDLLLRARIAAKSDEELRVLVEQLHSQRVEG